MEGLSILGTGSAVPETVVTNQMLEQVVDTSDQWITERTGIQQRRILAGQPVTPLAAEAARLALESAGTKADELDMIICATAGGDYHTPSLAQCVQQEIGAHCPAMDVGAACAGFLYAMDMAQAYISTGRMKRILLLGAEALTRLVDWDDRRTCILFGDGAGAAVAGPGNGMKHIELHSEPHIDWLNAPFKRTQHPLERQPDDTSEYLYMNGQEVYRYAVSYITEAVQGCLQSVGMQPDDIDYYILHQANLRIIEAARKRLKQPREKFPTSIERYGNTSAASVPILLDELNREGKLKRGDKLFISAFGAAMTAGSCIMEWGGMPGD